MLAADWHDTSCSPLRPPNRTASRIFGSDTRRLLGAVRATVDVVAGHPRADAGDDLVRDGVRPPGPVGHRRLSLGTGSEHDGLVTDPRGGVAHVDDELVHR